ncbi:hypothetical protein F5877DRAFT_63723 [Lentinula edodes]|nr:hypothetical protein F5877DRAFT_63723 [Lentinula edodes]
MQPVRPKMKKIILAGFVACMSLFGSSSGAPVPRHRARHPAESTTASLPASSPSSTTTTTTRSEAANGPTTSSRNPSSSSPSSRGSPTASPPRPSSFSLGLNLGQFDYAAAGIARRVSRVFVKRMSAGSSRSMGSARSTQVVQVVQKGGGEEGDRTATAAMTTNLVPVVEAGSASSLNFVDEEEEERGRVPVSIPVHGPRAAGQLDNEGHEPGMLRSTKESESESGEMVTPDIRACRWGCI